MLLILTNSLDGTSDEIVRRVGTGSVFRFNIDLWQDYHFEVDKEGFFLSDQTGRTCRSSDLRAAYLRKPTFDDPISIPEGGSCEAWLRNQIGYFLQELYNWCQRRGLVRLVEKGAQNRFGKFSQMWMAQRHFDVPEWKYTHGDGLGTWSEPCITKPLTADFTGGYRFLFTTRVDPTDLDPAYPWLLQKEIDATHDVTVAFVKGNCFAFGLDRASFQGIDWRKHINRQELQWKPWVLTKDEEHRIRSFMRDAQLDFGRLDFLADERSLYFLEVNPNGQWAWLDMDGEQGLFDAVVGELTRGWHPAVKIKQA